MQPPRRPRAPIALLSLTLIGIAGCATASRGIDTSCSSFSPITVSRRDTPETAEQVHRHNRRWVCLCENDCPVTPSRSP